MSFLNRLFGKKDTGTEQQPRSFKEKDNHGTRHDTESTALAYWALEFPRRGDPFVIYVFNCEKDARDALLELPCIHVAEDSGKLICTEVLNFGHYQGADGQYRAVISGGDLTHELWEQAKASFIKHGGQPKGQGELEPQKSVSPHQTGKAPQVDKVVFVKEERKDTGVGTIIKRIYKAPDAASAKSFLEQNSVTRQFYYIEVETPEGNYGRDIEGMYKW
jgi:hypothetical protein